MNEISSFSYFLFILLGLSSLLPWNAFISASQYFSLRFCDNEKIKRSFESVFSVIYMISQLTGLISQLILASQNKLQHSILLPITINSFIFMFIFASIFTTTSASTYFIFMGLNIFILGFTSVFLSAGTFQLAAELNSSKYASLLMIGQGCAGIIASVCSLALNYELDKTVSQLINVPCDVYNIRIIGTGPSWYFGFILILLLVSVLLSLLFIKQKSQYQPIQDNNDSHDKVYNNNDINNNIESSSSSSSILLEKSTIQNIAVELLPFSIPVTLIFIVTLSVFPGLTSVAQSCSSNYNNKFVSLLFFMYNITDTVGKYLSYYFQEFNDYIIPSIQIISIVRIIFIPIFLNFQHVFTDVNIIENNCKSCKVCVDLFPIIAISLLGLSNGFSSSLAMMHWPKATSEHSIGATIMIFSISIGLTIGAIVSLIITMHL